MLRQVLSSRLSGAGNDTQRMEIISTWILENFDNFYSAFLNVPFQAKEAFEKQHHAASIKLSRYRLSLYNSHIHEMGPFLKAVMPSVASDSLIWDRIELSYLRLISSRYESDVAYAFMHSVRRMVYKDKWQPVDYSLVRSKDLIDHFPPELVQTFIIDNELTDQHILAILQLPTLNAPFRDDAHDAKKIAGKINVSLARHSENNSALSRIEVVKAGFYRNRGCYIVGRMILENEDPKPIIIALINTPDGVITDAVLTEQEDAHNLFSSTLANFHVTTTFYHELNSFLFSIMPNRSLGLHYSTIGYNHLGKVAVLDELKQELEKTQGKFDIAVGSRGTVAIGFAGPQSTYNLKVIRNHPTEDYKWGEFEGIESVMKKYGRVHEINRTGSMLDNIIYFNIALEQDLFSMELQEELLQNASDTVSLQNDSIIFKYLIVQPRMTPLPIYFENADSGDIEHIIENLGDCIKNNAAANIFNKDLDARNYGVSHFRKVYLFDYDALEPFVDVKIRSNTERFDGEEDIPDWYFEDGVIFLPEEIEVGMRIPHRELRHMFRQKHGELYSTDYWEGLQQELLADQVPVIKVYPDSCRV
ncbi:MAG: isocitrate dehydrogenase kinase/phosphatase [Parasphingorhabdus sp.]|jgi:isocitrate dehydrogenase kinase/phosphatase